MDRYNRTLISEDYLRALSDTKLRSLFLDIRSQINKGRRKRYNVRALEEDFCWIQLEMQLRNEVRGSKKNTRNYHKSMQ